MFSSSIKPQALVALGIIACTACAGNASKTDRAGELRTFYTVTGEIALSRHEPRVAAVQYAAATAGQNDTELLRRAVEVAADGLQPSLAVVVASRWMEVDGNSLDARRAAGRAALELDDIEQSALQYRRVLSASPRGSEAELTQLAAELAQSENVFGARRLADRLAADFPASSAAAGMQGFAALRADDPAAAARALRTALALAPAPQTRADALAPDVRRDLERSLARARILAGDVDPPLAEARQAMERDDGLDRGDGVSRGEGTARGDGAARRRLAVASDRLDYALLLLLAHRNLAASAQLELLKLDTDAAPDAGHLLGLIDFQEGRLDEAGARFTELLTQGKFLDDAFYYLAVIAERRGDPQKALRLYAQVQRGDNALPALLHAAVVLNGQGATAAAEELFDRLVEDEPAHAPEILAARARMYGDAGKLAEAVGVLERGVLQYPDNTQLRYALASTYESQGRVSASLRELERVLKRRPADPAAMNALGFTLADHDLRLRRARELLERAHAAAPNNSAILDSLGWVLFRQGQAAQALPYLTAAYREDRGGDIAAHLGEVFWKQGRHADAEQVWTQAAALDADNRLLKDTRSRLQPAN